MYDTQKKRIHRDQPFLTWTSKAPCVGFTKKGVREETHRDGHFLCTFKNIFRGLQHTSAIHSSLLCWRFFFILLHAIIYLWMFWNISALSGISISPWNNNNNQHHKETYFASSAHILPDSWESIHVAFRQLIWRNCRLRFWHVSREKSCMIHGMVKINWLFAHTIQLHRNRINQFTWLQLGTCSSLPFIRRKTVANFNYYCYEIALFLSGFTTSIFY